MATPAKTSTQPSAVTIAPTPYHDARARGCLRVARGLDASPPTVVDLPDGSFELRPDPRVGRQTKRALGYFAGVSTGVHAPLGCWGPTPPRIAGVRGFPPPGCS